jgi:uncharacterized protein YcgI (DUF1989 family)
MAERTTAAIRIGVPARDVAALDVSAGSLITVVDLAGHQGADCLALGKDGGISCTQRHAA